MDQREVQAVADALWPMFQAAIQAAVDEATERSNRIVAVPGTVSSVDGASIEVQPAQHMGDPMYATCTSPATSAGERTMVLFLPDGNRLQIGRIPNS